MTDRRALITNVLVLGVMVLAFVLLVHAAHRSAAIATDCGRDSEATKVPAPSQPETPGTRILRHCLNEGRGDPWGTAFDRQGNLWIAEPGCDFAPTCPATTPPGQIGKIAAGSNAVRLYTLPNIPGNQPAFVLPDDFGNVWFTTPNNSMIGEFDSRAGKVVGQWPVTIGSGPWDLAFSTGALWYTERLVSAIGRFDPVSHLYIDVATPSPNSHPYGIAADDVLAPGHVWFTENNPAIARIGVVDTAQGNAVSEFAIRGDPPPTLTPHMIAIDRDGGIWWTEGFEGVVGHLDPKAASIEPCGSAAGTCPGIREYTLPPATGACPGSHISGIAVDESAPLVWFDDSLSSELGNINTLTGAVTMLPLQGCSAHAHDGLTIGPRNHVWWDEEFANALGELVR